MFVFASLSEVTASATSFQANKLANRNHFITYISLDSQHSYDIPRIPIAVTPYIHPNDTVSSNTTIEEVSIIGMIDYHKPTIGNFGLK